VFEHFWSIGVLLEIDVPVLVNDVSVGSGSSLGGIHLSVIPGQAESKDDAERDGERSHDGVGDKGFL